MFYKIIDNDEFIVIHKIKEIDFREISSIIILVVLDKILRIDKINKISKIRNSSSCCSYKSLQDILLLFEEVDFFLV